MRVSFASGFSICATNGYVFRAWRFVPQTPTGVARLPPSRLSATHGRNSFDAFVYSPPVPSILRSKSNCRSHTVWNRNRNDPLCAPRTVAAAAAVAPNLTAPGTPWKPNQAHRQFNSMKSFGFEAGDEGLGWLQVSSKAIVLPRLDICSQHATGSLHSRYWWAWSDRPTQV